jgi:alpha-1,3-rhamnosyl/mannosyltransferase
VATTQSPLPALLEGGGIFVEPRDEDALVRAMATMRCDRAARAEMGRVALERARLLSWERCARQALGAIHEAAA